MKGMERNWIDFGRWVLHHAMVPCYNQHEDVHEYDLTASSFGNKGEKERLKKYPKFLTYIKA